jgi:hypothetical protein
MNPKDLVGAKKAPLKLVPPALVIGVAEAMANGAEKYGAYNFRDIPVEMMTYIEAALRHLFAFMDGQDNAEDTGIHHLKHAGASIAIVLDGIAMGTIIDNRPSKGPAADLLRQQDKSAKANEPLILKNDEPEVWPLHWYTTAPWGSREDCNPGCRAAHGPEAKPFA